MPEEKEKENGIEIEIETDDKDVADGEKTAAKTEEKAAISAEEGVAELRAKLVAADEARLAAELRARSAEAREVSARGETHESQISLVNNALQATLQKEANLKKDLAEAHRNSDFDLVADLQTQIADNSNVKMRLQDGKAALEKQPKPVARPVIADPVEALASQLTPQSADWVRKHPEYARDPDKYSSMIAAHNLAVSDKTVVADSKEYFERVEQLLGVSKPDEPKLPGEEPLSASSKAVGGRGVQPAAVPANRGGGGTTRVVRLTQAEREAAAASGLTEVEYAKNKEALKAAGRLN